MMNVLPDYLRTGLKVVFCGTAAGTRSAAKEVYYAGTGNNFWRFLHEAGMTPSRLHPRNTHRICEFNCGLTDLAKDVAANSDAGLRRHYDIPGFLSKINKYEPKWIAFHGKEAAKAVARHFGIHGRIRLGPQSWKIGRSGVFVLPSASGANRDKRRLEGKQDRLDWFKELARMSG